MYKLIFADDEAIMRENIRNIIDWQSFGFKLAGVCANGHDLVEMAEIERPDLVILDINMPYIDGITAARLIKAEVPRVKLVLLTGYENFNYAQQAIELNVIKYILKPVSASSLSNILSEIKTTLDEEESAIQDYTRLLEFYEQKSDLDAELYAAARDQTGGGVVKRAIRYIEEHISEKDLTIDAVCDELHFSPSYMRSIFKKEEGVSFGAYLTDLRMKKAKVLLMNTDQKGYLIARQVGLPDQHYFSFCFKKYFGITPREMRKRG